MDATVASATGSLPGKREAQALKRVAEGPRHRRVCLSSKMPTNSRRTPGYGRAASTVQNVYAESLQR